MACADHAWKPGDVAMVTVNGEQRPAFRIEASEFSDPRRGPVVWCVQYDRDTLGLSDSEVTQARRVVVLDPADREQIEHLVAALPHCESFDGESLSSQLQTALRRLVILPKPPEPTGLGAVVKDDRGQLFVRTGYVDGSWHNPDEGQVCGWDYVTAVRILSEGVTP